MSYDPDAELWVPVPTRIEDEQAVASVDHLTLFDATVSWFGYEVQYLLGNRADPPTCDGSSPEWLYEVGVVEDRNAPLLACGEDAGDGRLRLRLVNNRGYAQSLAIPGAEVPVPGTLDLAQALSAALYRQVSDRVYVPPTSQIEVLVPRPDSLGEGVIELHGAVDFLSVGVDVAYVMFELLELPGSEATSFYDCLAVTFGTLASTSTPREVANAVMGQSRSCADSISAALGGIGEAGLSKWVAAAQIWDFSGTAGDLAGDTAFELALVALRLRPEAFVSARLTGNTPIGLRGIGPVEAGMTLAEAEEATGIRFLIEDFDTFEGYCYFAHAEGMEEDFALLLESPGPDPVLDPRQGVIGRVSATSQMASPAPTLSGVAVGSTVDEVHKAYPGQIEATPHAYIEGGQYLTYVPRDSADQPYRLRFFTNGNA